jgi:DNA invertase Pin-like site-specific DNA recombinase
MARLFVAYYRVSTQKQGRSGLGLEAQQAAVASYIASQNGGSKLIAAFQEVESGKRERWRPALIKAMDRCKLTGATLIIAKLDRLSRDARFLLELQAGGVPFLCADMPEANELTIGILAVVAEHERRMISERTKAALQAAKARGVKLGNPNGAAALRRGQAAKGGAHPEIPRAVASANAQARANDLRSTITALREQGVTSNTALAGALNEMGIRTARRGRWHPTSVRALLLRLA